MLACAVVARENGRERAGGRAGVRQVRALEHREKIAKKSSLCPCVCVRVWMGGWVGGWCTREKWVCVRARKRSHTHKCVRVAQTRGWQCTWDHEKIRTREAF